MYVGTYVGTNTQIDRKSACLDHLKFNCWSQNFQNSLQKLWVQTNANEAV